MRTISCVASTVLYQINDVSNTLTDTQEHVESKVHQLGTERKSMPLVSRIWDSELQCKHSHTKSGEVCLEVKQRALLLSFRLAKNSKHIDTTITVRNNIGGKTASSFMKRQSRALAW